MFEQIYDSSLEQYWKVANLDTENKYEYVDKWEVTYFTRDEDCVDLSHLEVSLMLRDIYLKTYLEQGEADLA